MMYATTPTNKAPQVNVPLFPILKSILKIPRPFRTMPKKKPDR
jgi:hypothetical protein